MAVALSWKGCVDTNVNFAEFFSANHTLITRFMPQFPNTYEGPFVAENGTGTFGVGQGDFLSGTNGTKLYLAVGTQMTTRAATLTRDKWHHLAVVVTVSATQRTFALLSRRDSAWPDAERGPQCGSDAGGHATLRQADHRTDSQRTQRPDVWSAGRHRHLHTRPDGFRDPEPPKQRPPPHGKRSGPAGRLYVC
jgi:hypothetical protein